MEYIIFRNPKIIFRKEKFGGILRLDSSLLVIGKKEYDILNKQNKYSKYSLFNKKDIKIVDKFLKYNIFLKIEKTRAEELIQTTKK
ncbi:hypothetical protein J4409_02970 [Candidatus Woesearchaeota archaeon]|nr:hypothetical protein [Candidatus Woesearchaeota archaeon]